MTQEVNNYHVTYPDVYRHWSASCEQYAGGDCLVTMLMRGWTFTENIVYVQEFWHAGTRPVTVFHFELGLRDARMTMPVITNPYVRRVIRMHRLEQRPLSEKAPKRAKDADAV
ncbi:MAG: hypothetical protein SF162_16555 [bacterium]|nr:hypothetical protein [bacterium]